MSAAVVRERKSIRTYTSPPDAGQPEYRDYKIEKSILTPSLSLPYQSQPEINIVPDSKVEDSINLFISENDEKEKNPRKLSPDFRQEEIDNVNEETKFPIDIKGSLSLVEEDFPSDESTPLGAKSIFSQFSNEKSKLKYSEDEIRKAGDEDWSWVLPIEIVKILRRNCEKPQMLMAANSNYKNSWRAEEDETQKKIRQGAIETTKKVNAEKTTKEKVLCQIKIILNKMSLVNFDKLKEELFEIAKSNEEYLEPLAGAIFQKACFEKKYVGMYADLCKYLSNEYLDFQLGYKVDPPKKTQDSLFRKILLNICQESFEDMWTNNFKYKNEPVYKVKSLGCAKFIGELFKIGLIPPKIIFTCLMELISQDFKEKYKNPDINSLQLDDDKLEGAILILLAGGFAFENEKNLSRTNAVVNALSEIMTRNLTNSRNKFLILDMIELRASGWQPRPIESPIVN
ncbi:EIF4G_1 [Blepharisma stoltei]|uniref:MIF4G domain-containing protein n=1 Tax=Blepharisma stoltei TaxID=1481888 RepID=A0AAU9IPZ6_9CILI|nr:unnamed protein product [Blepharisma stoltei]